MHTIAVHGGAGRWPEGHSTTALNGVRRAVQAGLGVLARKGGALDAVVQAVVVLEDDPVFNAGTGSVLNLDGEAQMDAGVMVSGGARTGNVAAVRGIRHPVRLARQVMEQTPHTLLAGRGAERFAAAMGHERYDPVTHERLRQWRERRQHWRAPAWVDPAYLRSGDTVGAVALDSGGSLAAATSTGGTALKLPGRVGDSPLPGAGNYADAAGAASGTGTGELLTRAVLAFRVVQAMARGCAPSAALSEVFQQQRRLLGAEAGVIALDATGRVGAFQSAPAMPYGFASERQRQPIVRLRAP